MSLTRDQLRAARALLNLDQVEMAKLSDVALVTLRRYESGLQVTDLALDKLRAAVEAAGAILIEPGSDVRGTSTGIGVVLLAEGALPEPTRRRIADASVEVGRQRPKRNPELPKRARPGRPTKRNPPA